MALSRSLGRVAGWLGWGAVWVDESVLVCGCWEGGSRGVRERRLAMGAVSTDGWERALEGGVRYGRVCYAMA
jgi:hypothetical protein